MSTAAAWSNGLKLVLLFTQWEKKKVLQAPNAERWHHEDVD